MAAGAGGTARPSRPAGAGLPGAAGGEGARLHTAFACAAHTDAPLCSQHRKQQIAATIHGEGEFSAEPTLPDTEHIWNTQGMDFHMVDRSDEVPTLPNSRDLSHPGVWTALLSF